MHLACAHRVLPRTACPPCEQCGVRAAACNSTQLHAALAPVVWSGVVLVWSLTGCGVRVCVLVVLHSRRGRRGAGAHVWGHRDTVRWVGMCVG